MAPSRQCINDKHPIPSTPPKLRRPCRTLKNVENVARSVVKDRMDMETAAIIVENARPVHRKPPVLLIILLLLRTMCARPLRGRYRKGPDPQTTLQAPPVHLAPPLGGNAATNAADTSDRLLFRCHKCRLTRFVLTETAMRPHQCPWQATLR